MQSDGSSCLGQGISEAIAEIQTRRMTAALAEIAVGFAGNPRLGFVSWDINSSLLCCVN